MLGIKCREKPSLLEQKGRIKNDMESGQTSDRIGIMRARMAVKRNDKRGEGKARD
jgi:hypothetical protein